jgi:hypothetical protein
VKTRKNRKKQVDDSRTTLVTVRVTDAALSSSPFPRYSATYFTAATWSASGARAVNVVYTKVRVENTPISAGINSLESVL